MSNAPDHAAAVRRWRTICIANTVGGAIATVTAIVFWPLWLAICVTISMALAVVDSWYLARRVAETGNPFIRPRRSPPAQ